MFRAVHIVGELGRGVGGGTRIGQALIVINVKILPKRTQKPESTRKNMSGNIKGALNLISPIGLLIVYKKKSEGPKTLITNFNKRMVTSFLNFIIKK